MTLQHEFYTSVMDTHHWGRKDGVLFLWMQNHWKALDEDESVTFACKWLQAHHQDRAMEVNGKTCIAWLTRMVPLVPDMDPARCIIPLADCYLEVMPDGKTIRRLSPIQPLG
jgi:hypothetical protein